MNVGFEEVGDLHSVRAGDVDVVLDVTPGVDHTGHPGLGAADDIGQASHMPSTVICLKYMGYAPFDGR